jgi:voltage-gated potassium channel
MKRTNSFVLFGRAFKNAKNDFWVSIQVLLVATFVLALLFYFVEHTAQPEEYKNPWDAFVWAITRYIGDPGHFAGKGPITLTGRYIDTFIGILKILIFAVPAGLVANGFRQAMADDKRKRHLEECRMKIRKSFRRILNKKTQYRVIPRRMPIITLQAKKGMNEKDIIDTVTKYDEFCLRNLATSQTAAEHPQDRLVIEMLPLDLQTVDGFDIVRTSYGVKINRNSNITIISPTAASENSIGHFAYYLAQFGGFNYVSREFITDVDEPVSYYTIDGKENEWELPLKDFVNDIKAMSLSNEKWNIVLVSSDNVYDTQFHFVHRANEKSGLSQTTLDEERFNVFYSAMAEKMHEEFEYLSDLDEKYRPIGKKNIGVITGGGKTNNAFTLRVSYSVTTWTDSALPIVVEMAKVIKQHLESPEHNQFVEHPSWKEKGCGYGKNEDEDKQ